MAVSHVCALGGERKSEQTNTKLPAVTIRECSEQMLEAALDAVRPAR